MLDWSKYITVANKLQHKAKPQDREDLNHTIILSLADAQLRLDNDSGGELSDIAMLRIASYECQKYWRKQKRLLTILSLNEPIDDGDGNTTELIDTLADDKAIDLDAWLYDKTFLLGCPMRLIQIAHKIVNGQALNNKDRQYLWYWRQKEQKKLDLS
jgi:hypothetical protein